MRRKQIYWICQFGGWLSFILINLFILQLGDPVGPETVLSLVFTLFYGIATTHILRFVIIRFRLLRLAPMRMLVLFVFFSLVMGFLFYLVQRLFLSFTTGLPANGFFSWSELPFILNISLVYLIWIFIYVMVHLVENYKREEIKKLKYQALSSEMEFNTLRAQLNPHFLFNALNSIRALIDENPSQAREAVTSLSTILRTSLQLGRKPLITLEEELRLVQDYLKLESARYEERLKVVISDTGKVGSALVPPMIIQSLAENAIKHGISKLPGGGTVQIEIKSEDQRLILQVLNSGSLHGHSGNPDRPGVGLRNIRQRLNLLYGESAGFTLSEDVSGMVAARIILPLKYEDDPGR